MDEGANKNQPTKIAGGTVELLRRLRNTGAGVNLSVAVVVFAGYMVASESWSPKASLLCIGFLLILNPFIIFLARLIFKHVNRDFLSLIDLPFDEWTPEKIVRARLVMLRIPWLAGLFSAVIWTIILPIALQFGLSVFDEHGVSWYRLIVVMIAVWPFCLLAIMLGFDIALRPYVPYLADQDAEQWQSSRTALTVRKRLTMSFFLIGPYSIVMFALLVYQAVKSSGASEQTLSKLAQIEFFSLCVSLLMLVTVAVYVGKQIDHPINSLLRSLRAICSGDLQKRLPIESFDDFGAIASRFNRMAVGLEERQRLSHINEDLVLQLDKRARQAEELLKLYDAASVAARTDALSGLYNRRAFEEFLIQNFSSYKRYQIPICIILLDIDHFKKFNDTFGHAVGDQVIYSVAAMLKLQIRLSDVPARWGGEEFIICLPQSNLEASQVVAERIRKACECMELTDSLGAPLPAVTVSLGIGTARDEDEFAEQIVERADQGLYLAKNKGRNQMCSVEPGWSDLDCHQPTHSVTVSSPVVYERNCKQLEG